MQGINSPLLDGHRQQNRSTRDSAQSFASHRRATTALVLNSVASVRSTASSLCLLGVGNGNDLDLLPIVERFSVVHLVDLDSEALEFSRSKFLQTAADLSTPLQVDCTCVDITGLFCSDDELRTRIKPSDWCQLSRNYQLPLPPDRFDCVASTCVLSQLVSSAQSLVSESSPGFASLVLEVRRKHLEQMIQLLKPSAVGVLITDFVSSVTWPDLARLS